MDMQTQKSYMLKTKNELLRSFTGEKTVFQLFSV